MSLVLYLLDDMSRLTRRYRATVLTIVVSVKRNYETNQKAYRHS